MNKAQLSEAIALRTGLTKADARKAVDALVSIAAQTFREIFKHLNSQTLKYANIQMRGHLNVLAHSK